jgi:hypothetical protein
MQTRATPSSRPPIPLATTPTRPMPRARTRAPQQGEIREPGKPAAFSRRWWIAPRADAARRVENPILNYLSAKTAAVYILMTHLASLLPAFCSLPAPSHTV